MNAAILLRPEPKFRFEAFASGLASLGFQIATSPKADPAREDVLVLWNRYPQKEAIARRYENAGARVLIAENGYLGREWLGSVWYALSANQHNGAGEWPAGECERWDRLRVELAPWRTPGSEVVVFDQRGFGHPKVRMPRGWAETAAANLKRSHGRPVRIRRHPGERGGGRSLEEDLRDAWCCVTWNSGAALKAILMGVPVFHAFPSWIGAAAAQRLRYPIGDPFVGDRLPMLQRLAWAMWEVDEIASGRPFRCLLG